MKSMGKDAGLLRVTLEENGQILVEGEVIGHLEGFRFVVDADASREDRKLLLSAAERYMPYLLAQKARALVTSELGELTLGRDADGTAILREGGRIAKLEATRNATHWRLVLDKQLAPLDQAQRTALEQALEHWLEVQLAPLAPLRALEEASQDPEAGTEVRALLLTLIDHHGMVPREQAKLASIDKDKRPLLRQLGITIGSLDVYVPALLKPAARKLLHDLGLDSRELNEQMQAVIMPHGPVPAGYRRAGRQAVRIDMAEKLFRAAHDSRMKAGGRTFRVDEMMPTSMGLVPENQRQLLREAGFRTMDYVELAEGMFGPPAPRLWSWRPPRKDHVPRVQQAGGRPQRPSGDKPARRADHSAPTERKPDGPPPGGGAFAGLADLLR